MSIRKYFQAARNRYVSLLARKFRVRFTHVSISFMILNSKVQMCDRERERETIVPTGNHVSSRAAVRTHLSRPFSNLRAYENESQRYTYIPMATSSHERKNDRYLSLSRGIVSRPRPVRDGCLPRLSEAPPSPFFCLKDWFVSRLAVVVIFLCRTKIQVKKILIN